MNQEMVVLITGCSTGIGRALCQTLTQKGCKVIATARHVNSVKNLHAALMLPLDVTDRKSVNLAVSEVITRFGKIDLLINNAGIHYEAH